MTQTRGPLDGTAGLSSTSVPPEAPRSAGRRRLWSIARLLVTAAAFAYLLTIVKVGDLFSAIGALPWQAFASAVVLAYVAVAVGTLRWWVLLGACGASSRPSFSHMYRLYLVGMFYNHFAPGAIGGDIVRGVATASCFERDGVTSSVAVTVLDRATGFTGLLLVFGAASWVRPLEGMGELNRWAGLGGIVAAAGIVGLLLARHTARFLPRALGSIIERLPRLHSLIGLFVAVLLSLLTHSFMVAMTHVLASSLVSSLTVSDSFVVTPVAMLASYFPLTVGGAGAREGAFVALYPLVGVPEPIALATSLAWWGATLVMAGSGGLINAFVPLGAREPTP